jgi:hypothetical protein
VASLEWAANALDSLSRPVCHPKWAHVARRKSVIPSAAANSTPKVPDRPPPYKSWDALFACGSQSVMVDPNPSPWLSARSVPPWASAI